MIGDLFNNNRKRDVVTREDQVMRFGKKWRQDKKTRILYLYDRFKKKTSRGDMGA